MTSKYMPVVMDWQLEDIVPEGINGAELQGMILEEAANLGYSVEETIHKRYQPFWPFGRTTKRVTTMEKGQTNLYMESLDPEKDYHSFKIIILGLDGIRPIDSGYEKHFRNYAELTERIVNRLKARSRLGHEPDIL